MTSAWSPAFVPVLSVTRVVDSVTTNGDACMVAVFCFIRSVFSIFMYDVLTLLNCDVLVVNWLDHAFTFNALLGYEGLAVGRGTHGT